LGNYDIHAPDVGVKTFKASISIQCYSQPANAQINYCITITPRQQQKGAKPQALYNNTFNWIGLDFFDVNRRAWGNPKIGGDYPAAGMTGSFNTAANTDQTINIPFIINAYLYSSKTSILTLGLFQNIFTAQLYYTYANIADPQQLCSATPPPGTYADTPRNMTVQVTAIGSCTIKTVSAINFGKYFSLDKVPPATGQIDVYCTKGLIYKLGLNGGQNAKHGKRAMKCRTPDTCGNNLIYYDIYQDAAGKQIWGNNSDNSVKYTADNSTRSYHPTARIYAGQTTPPAGNYRDTIIVTLK